MCIGSWRFHDAIKFCANCFRKNLQYYKTSSKINTSEIEKMQDKKAMQVVTMGTPECSEFSVRINRQIAPPNSWVKVLPSTMFQRWPDGVTHGGHLGARQSGAVSRRTQRQRQRTGKKRVQYRRQNVQCFHHFICDIEWVCIQSTIFAFVFRIVYQWSFGFLQQFLIYSRYTYPRSQGSVRGRAFEYVCLSVRVCNWKTIAPIDWIFVHKKCHARGSVLL